MSLAIYELQDDDAAPPDIEVLHFLGVTALRWLMQASKLPGRSLHLAVAVKLQWDLAGHREFSLQSKLSAAFGIDRYAERRALQALSSALLIRVVRRRGARPRVTVLGADVAPRARAK